MSVFSSAAQRARIARLVSQYARLPFASGTAIPGSVMMAALAEVRGGKVLETYDYVDVIKSAEEVGWQVKSTKASTPVTWKRAKIPGKSDLIDASMNSEKGLQVLGDAIIGFCNDHIRESMIAYNLKRIGYARLVVHDDSTALYFEKELATREAPVVFHPGDFRWRWSAPKRTAKKEQLSALHGTHIPSKKKWWAWHGLGENQLHFTGEATWWPSPRDETALAFKLPGVTDRMTMEEFLEAIETA